MSERREEREGTMDSTREGREHPVDALPEYVRGTAAEADHIGRHLESCPACREQAEVLRALASAPAPGLAPEERERLLAAIDPPAGLPASRPRTGPAGWRSVGWKVAATIALAATGFGVWQVNRTASRAGGAWDPAAAVAAWEEDLADLRPDPADVQVALGVDPDGVVDLDWDELEPVDAGAVRGSWEGDR